MERFIEQLEAMVDGLSAQLPSYTELFQIEVYELHKCEDKTYDTKGFYDEEHITMDRAGSFQSYLDYLESGGRVGVTVQGRDRSEPDEPACEFVCGVMELVDGRINWEVSD